MSDAIPSSLATVLRRVLSEYIDLLNAMPADKHTGRQVAEACACLEQLAALPDETTADGDAITSLCDRLDRIHKIALDRVTNDSARLVMIANESEGFMPIPTCSICKQRHAEPEQDCPQLGAQKTGASRVDELTESLHRSLKDREKQDAEKCEHGIPRRFCTAVHES